MRTYTFDAPAYWASALINGDTSSFSDEDEWEFNEWCEACRLARYAARARAAGDTQQAERFEARALSLVEGRPVRHESRVRVLGRAVAIIGAVQS